MDWLKPLDEYCERLSPDFWAEPVNAISNLSFIIGAFFALKLRSRLQSTNWSHIWLTFILFSVGVGSFLYHTFANLWSMFADIIPIYIFQLSMIIIYGATIGRVNQKSPTLFGFLFLAGFILLTLPFSSIPREIFNGSLVYSSAFLSLLFIGLYQAKAISKERYTMLFAAAMFAVALLFRTLDMELCETIQLGTHFLWHVFNGIVLYLAIRAYIGVLVHEENITRQSSATP